MPADPPPANRLSPRVSQSGWFDNAPLDQVIRIGGPSGPESLWWDVMSASGQGTDRQTDRHLQRATCPLKATRLQHHGDPLAQARGPVSSDSATNSE